ncbi:MAG: hypothetical protein AAF738_09780, partial [Bacteroidota bacterium]
MNFSDFLGFKIIKIDDYALTASDLLLAIGASLLWILVAWVLLRHLLPKLYEVQEVQKENRQKINRLIWSMIIIVGVIILVQCLGLNFPIYQGSEERYSLYVHTILQGLIIFQAARLADWLIYRFIIDRYKDQGRKRLFEKPATPRKKKTQEERRAGRMIQSIVYAFALFFLIQLFGLDERLPYYDIKDGNRIVASNIVLVAIA